MVRLGVMGFGEENQKGEMLFSSHHIMYKHGLSMTTLLLIISLRLCLSGFSAKKLLPIPPTPFCTLLFGRKSLFSWECVPFLWLLVCQINLGCILVIINVKCRKSWFCFVFLFFSSDENYKLCFWVEVPMSKYFLFNWITSFCSVHVWFRGHWDT